MRRGKEEVLCKMCYRADLVVRWSCAGLTRASICFARSLYEEGWIAGSSPAMTAVLLDLCCARWTQPTDARNDRRPRSIVSGLLFTMSFATATCRAFQRPSRIQVAAR